MRRVVLVVILVFGLVSAQSIGAQSQSSDGPYIGVVTGFGWGNSSQRDEVIPTPPPPEEEVPADGDYRVRGGTIGLTAGYNVLIGQLLLGIEGDINWSEISGSSALCGGNHVCGTNLEGFGTLRARAGISLSKPTLAYVTGGLAVGRIHAFDKLDPAFQDTKIKAGWTIGGGLEHKLDLKWSLKLEYLYMHFGRDEYFTIPNHTPERVDLDVHVARIGLNYALGDPIREPLK